MSHLLARDLDEIIERVSPEVWNGLKGRRIFITGGTGFAGTWLLESLVWANRKLSLDVSATVLTRRPQQFSRKAPHLANAAEISFVTGDQRSFGPPPGEFFFLIHAATENQADAFASNVEGTRRILDFSRQCSAEKLLFLSSGAVYGAQPPTLKRIPETYLRTHAAKPTENDYAESKRVSEQLLLGRGSPPPGVVVARLFAFAGPHLKIDANFAAGNFLRDVLNGGRIQISGDGTPLRTYLYAADLAAWLWTLLVEGTPGSTYNVGGRQIVSIAELAGTVAAATLPSTEIIIANQPPSNAVPSRYVPDTSRAEALGLRAWTPLDEAIRRWYAWHLHSRVTS